MIEYEKSEGENMSLPSSIMSMVEGWYEDYLEQGHSEEKAADLAQEKFENDGHESPSLLEMCQNLSIYKDLNHE